ncbi:ABC transporter ATP-binding protein [Chondromyces apiculatus]|nr:ABC transporter ATP-binding protein [Chondromyces apiculatus]
MAPAQSVVVKGLSKVYQVHERGAGLTASLRSLFHRRYRAVQAVQDLSFSIAPGERVGFLGPNGAGKTTTLKVLSGLLHPTEGEVLVSGFVPQRRQVEFLKQITLVMGQKQQLLWDLPPVETFALNRAIYDIEERTFKQTLDELTTLLDIGTIAQKPTRQLSLGERMKCELAAALLHRPQVLFLDEPTIGLDVSMQLTVREFIHSYNERHGATVILTSHYMDDVAALCPRVIVIDHGRLRYDGSLPDLVRSVNPHKQIALRTSAPLDRAALERVGAVVALDAARAVLQVPRAALHEAVAHLLGRPEVTDLTVEDPPLEEVMRAFFARPTAEQEAAP